MTLLPKIPVIELVALIGSRYGELRTYPRDVAETLLIDGRACLPEEFDSEAGKPIAELVSPKAKRTTKAKASK